MIFREIAFRDLVDIIEKETKVERTKKPRHINLLTCHGANHIGS